MDLKRAGEDSWRLKLRSPALSSLSLAAGARLTDSPQPQEPVWFGLVNTNCEDSFSVR